jgi:hypothetical protein
MFMDSNVVNFSPWAYVHMNPQDEDEYGTWNWTVDIDDGDIIIIDTICNYTNYYPSGNGYHNFVLDGTYVKGLDVRSDDADYSITTKGSGESGSHTLTITLAAVDEGGVIYVNWYVEAINQVRTPPVDDGWGRSGIITLT